MRLQLLLFFFLPVFYALPAQDRYSPWGVVPESDLKMTVYPSDSTAGAVVLQDVGNIHLDENNRGDWVVKFEYWRRIKIFNTASLDQGNLLIHYSADKSIEKINDLDVQVIFPDGTVKKVKSDNIYTEKVADHWKIKKVFIPGLQPGCVVEYRYKLTKSYISSLYDWYFQDDIPVRWSEITVIIPEFFDYAFIMKNIGKLDIDEQNKFKKERISYGEKYKAGISRFGMSNLPALKEEPFITTIDDYRAGIQFQRTYSTVLLSTDDSASVSWKSLAMRMCLMPDFGVQYIFKRYSENLWADFSKNIEGDSVEVLMEKARKFVSGQIKWNEDFSAYAEQTLDDAYRNKTGNSAEINMTVIALLRRAGLRAYPVMVSTRDNGKVQSEYPLERQFNSVVAAVRHHDTLTLIDAIDPYIPVGRMHAMHYNDQSWLVDVERPEWIKTTPPEAAIVWLAKMQLHEAGNLTGSMDVQAGNDIATLWRNAIKEEEKETFVRENILQGYKECRFDSLVISDREEVDKPLKLKMEIDITDAANIINDYIYVKPVLDFILLENPFKSEQRSYPVSFPYPMKASYVMNLQIPAGYDLVELPKQERITLPDNLGNITFSCSKDKLDPRMIQTVLKMQLKGLEFDVPYYDALRTYFNLVAEKTAFQLVLKKTN